MTGHKFLLLVTKLTSAQHSLIFYSDYDFFVYSSEINDFLGFYNVKVVGQRQRLVYDTFFPSPESQRDQSLVFLLFYDAIYIFNNHMCILNPKSVISCISQLFSFKFFSRKTIYPRQIYFKRQPKTYPTSVRSV